MSFRPQDIVAVLLHNDGSYSAIEPTRWVGSKGDAVDIEIGFRTDFASVPWFLRSILAVVGRGARAALVHDRLCTALNNVWMEEHAGHVASSSDWQLSATFDSVDTDGVFRLILGELGVPDVSRWLYWTGVRWGALFNPARRDGWWRTAPKVVGISVLAAPVIVPVAIITLAAGAVLAAVGLVVDVLTGQR